MENLHDVLRFHNIDPSEPISNTVHDINLMEKSQTYFEEQILSMLDIDETYEDLRHAKFTYMYVVQNAVRNPELSKLETLQKSQHSAREWIKNNPWAFAAAEDEEEQLDDQGNVKHKRGWKVPASYKIYCENHDKTKKEIMELFQKELDMTHTGSQTYYYNNKKLYENAQ